ncbi:hypothetical protein [uncultured Lacinutrix sp.]|uniref:hypothetical protein n=1 Tax=uncultured Lacinutrix sp. TaxID=574032 RepID=UPI002635082E|nr:hypothetical protein [uncultured Lacinutrix sp.]
MKRTVILIALFLSLSIGFSQSINQVVEYGEGKQMLLGKIDKKGLTKATFKEWFNKNHDAYLANNKIIKTIKDSLKGYTIKAFLGTWCGDSKKEVPRFYSVLEEANYPMNQLEVIALNRSDDAYKQGPNGEEKGMNIHRVPTFIFYKDGKEVNRIVEHPKETFERDILKITTTTKYRPNYLAVTYLNNQLENKSLDSLKTMETELIPRLAEFVKGSRELNTYGYVFLRAEQTEKALYIFDLNTKIFPYKHNVYDSLGEAYFITKNYTEALKNYYKVLSLKPEDKNALEMIAKIKALS